MESPAFPSGHRPWQHPARERLALAPPHWVAAAPPRPKRRRRARNTALLVAATCGLAAIARAQVAPDTGGAAAPAAGGGDTGTAPAGPAAPATPIGAAAAAASGATPGTLRAQVEGVLPVVNAAPAGPTTEPAWTVTPGLSLQEEWTDNLFGTPTEHKSSLITQLSPSLTVNGTTARLTANLYYSPTVELYTPQGSQNQVEQNLGAGALLSVVPQQVFVQANAFATMQSLNGATAPNGAIALDRSNELQTYNFSVEPYIVHHFGGWGSLQAGVAASETEADQIGGGSPVQSLTTRQAFASFTTGENFNRLSSTVAASFSQQTGTGVLQGAVDDTVSWQASYAITHAIFALGSIGWENIRYGGIDSPVFDDGTWSIGTQLIPNPDSSITVSYGHQQGATSAAVNASYAPSATIRLFAQYSAGITTATQALNNALNGATFNAQGQPVNSQTGQQISPTSNFFGFNDSVYQQRTLTVGIDWLLPRDAFQLNVQQQSQTPVGNNAGTTVLASNGALALGAGLAASSGTTGTISWQHDLSPVLNTTMSFQYGILNNATPLSLTNGVLTIDVGQQIQRAELININAGLNWQMSRTLTGSLQYSYSSNDYSGGLPGIAINLVVVGLRKTF